MRKDFFEVTTGIIGELNQTERKLYDFVVKNMKEVQEMSIQKFASQQYLSTTSIFRFTQKLGFKGYADFINSLIVTTHINEKNAQIENNPTIFERESYLKNISESVRVLSVEQLDKINYILQKKPRIYILTDDHTHTIGQYCERLFIGLGFHAYFPETAYQRQNLINRIRDQDLIIALSYSGDDPVLLELIKRVFLSTRPQLLSITRADNNPLENISDHNFYVFADEIKGDGMYLTSSVGMLMIVELLAYGYMSDEK